MEILEKVSRIQTRVLNEKRRATPDWLERVKNYHAGLIRDDRVTCYECKNNKGRCLANQAWHFPQLKQRCIKFLKL